MQTNAHSEGQKILFVLGLYSDWMVFVLQRQLKTLNINPGRNKNNVSPTSFDKRPASPYPTQSITDQHTFQIQIKYNNIKVKFVKKAKIKAMFCYQTHQTTKQLSQYAIKDSKYFLSISGFSSLLLAAHISGVACICTPLLESPCTGRHCIKEERKESHRSRKVTGLVKKPRVQLDLERYFLVWKEKWSLKRSFEGICYGK